MASHDNHSDEEIPLLQGKAKTPVPWGQVGLAYVAMFAEPISSAYIFPFINQVGQQSFANSATRISDIYFSI